MRFFALLPQQEMFDEQMGIQTPPGFNMVVLPYAEDIRSLDSIIEAAGFSNAEDREYEPSFVNNLNDQEKIAARLLIKNLTIDFDSHNFENPII